MTEQITKDHWVCHDLDVLKDKLLCWFDDTVDRLAGERKVSSRVDDEGKLHFKIHDMVLTNPKDTGDEQDFYVTVERVESTEG